MVRLVIGLLEFVFIIHKIVRVGVIILIQVAQICVQHHLTGTLLEIIQQNYVKLNAYQVSLIIILVEELALMFALAVMILKGCR